jgi:hypothetical protein
MTIRQFIKLLRDYYGNDDGYYRPTLLESAHNRLCAMDMDDDPRQITLIGAVLLELADYISFPWRVAYCETFGHRMDRDTSYGGPDSGYMGCACSRCGGEWGQQLY